jgi:Aldehyde oxidase and xanthine dehydrogenase, a/b hammerhead domain
MELPRMAHVVFLRSPHAHAKIARIDADTAKRMPGVIAVATGEETGPASRFDTARIRPEVFASSVQNKRPTKISALANAAFQHVAYPKLASGRTRQPCPLQRPRSRPWKYRKSAGKSFRNGSSFDPGLPKIVVTPCLRKRSYVTS